MSDELPLAAEFPASTHEDWLKLVRAALKDRAFERLTAKTYDGLAIEPLYPRAKNARPIAGRHGPWQVMARADHPDPAAANAQALQELENGATGLALVFPGAIGANGYGLDASAAGIAKALDGIYLDAGIAIELHTAETTKDAGDHVAALVKSRGLAPGAVSIRFGHDPLGAHAAGGGAPIPWSDLAPRFAGHVAELAALGFKGPLTAADGRIVHNAGGSEAQELAYVLSVAAAYLRALEGAGVALDAARGMIGFRLSADADEFLTIAKFRALRLLWARIEAACGLAPAPAFISAETAWRTMAQRDPWTNMLRGSIAAFAAGVGGADAITVLPFTAALGLPDPFARRIARNIQLLLLEEFEHLARRRPGRGLGRHRGPDAEARTGRVGAVPGDRTSRRRAGGARSRPDPGQGRRGARRAREGGGAAPRGADRHQRLPAARRDAGRCARRQAGRGGILSGQRQIRIATGHPPCRTVRKAARRRRPRAGQERLTAESLSRQSRHAGRVQCARDLRQEFLRGRRHRGGHQRRLCRRRGHEQSLQGVWARAWPVSAPRTTSMQRVPRTPPRRWRRPVRPTSTWPAGPRTPTRSRPPASAASSSPAAMRS